MDAALLKAKIDDEQIGQDAHARLEHPVLDASHYYRQVATDPYFAVLTHLRHHVRAISDAYFSNVVGAKNVDLFLMTSSVSSPAGPGSDSEPIPLTFGGFDTYLVDSSQFGFEPVLIGGVPRAYCYLASMRGEDPDKRHLNQFYHCEYEAQETFEVAQAVAEGYVRSLASLIKEMTHTVEKLSQDPKKSREALDVLLATKLFQQITFDEAEALLLKHGYTEGIRESVHGKDLTSAGERELLKILGTKAPVWVTHYHRDRVPFYQKPAADNSERVINGDLLFPSIIENAFGGEVLGMGQRQDSVEEMYESMRRQGIDPNPYEWYVDLRRISNYKTTSGFGLGIERFISWVLGFDNISKAILYPRMKGTQMHP
ncbi:MAG: amino acid--tRNA ligase-related protein [Patescibacteria group bacterium]